MVNTTFSSWNRSVHLSNGLHINLSPKKRYIRNFSKNLANTDILLMLFSLSKSFVLILWEKYQVIIIIYELKNISFFEFFGIFGKL